MLKTRIAPTPSGYLHLGNVYSFILTWLFAKQQNGRILLRIDDLDKARVRNKYIDDVFRTLDWLGMDYDEGPSGTDDFLKNHSQHKRLDLYEKLLERLESEQHLFYCTCSRAQIKATSEDGQYPGSCIQKNIDATQTNTAWRLLHNKDFTVTFKDTLRGSVNRNLWQQMRYPVLKRKDGLPAYQIASIADDTHFNINTIVRGEDLLDSTAVQIHLAKLLRLNSFAENTFLHHTLIKDDQTQKLSKSQAAPAVKAWKEKKNGKTLLLRKIAVLLNVEPDSIVHIKDLLQQFTLPKLDAP